MVSVVLLLYLLGHVDLGISSSGAMNHKCLWMFLFSSFVSVSSSPDSLQDPQYVLKGQEINFLPSIPGKPDRVGWIHEGRDVVWFDPQTGKEDVSPSYKDRITLEQESARLTIKDATYEDSGNYDLKLMINDQHHRLKYRIEVIEPFEKTKKRIRRSPCNTPDVSQDLKYVLKGQEINFKPPIPEKPDLIIWFYHDGRGVVLLDDKGEFNFPSYEDRIILDHNTAELTINNATFEDSGRYILRWNINNEECHLKYPVEVIDKVTKPNISCEMVNLNQAVLACLTEGESDPLIKFKWRSQGYEQTGPILEINLSDEQDVYHCDVSNPLTNETASFLAKDCFRNNIPKVEIPNSTDWTYYVIVGADGCLVTILGYIVCRKSSCSEHLKNIPAKCFEKQETTEARTRDEHLSQTREPIVHSGCGEERQTAMVRTCSEEGRERLGEESYVV